MKGSLVTFRVDRVNGLYLFQGSTLDLSGKASVTQSLDSAMLWYRILGHARDKGPSDLSKKGVLSIELLGFLESCEHYVFGKQTRVKFSKDQHTTIYALGYIHFDLWACSYPIFRW